MVHVYDLEVSDGESVGAALSRTAGRFQELGLARNELRRQKESDERERDEFELKRKKLLQDYELDKLESGLRQQRDQLIIEHSKSAEKRAQESHETAQQGARLRNRADYQGLMDEAQAKSERMRASSAAFLAMIEPFPEEIKRGAVEAARGAMQFGDDASRERALRAVRDQAAAAWDKQRRTDLQERIGDMQGMGFFSSQPWDTGQGGEGKKPEQRPEDAAIQEKLGRLAQQIEKGTIPVEAAEKELLGMQDALTESTRKALERQNRVEEATNLAATMKQTGSPELADAGAVALAMTLHGMGGEKDITTLFRDALQARAEGRRALISKLVTGEGRMENLPESERGMLGGATMPGQAGGPRQFPDEGMSAIFGAPQAAPAAPSGPPPEGLVLGREGASRVPISPAEAAAAAAPNGKPRTKSREGAIGLQVAEKERGRQAEKAKGEEREVKRRRDSLEREVKEIAVKLDQARGSYRLAVRNKYRATVIADWRQQIDKLLRAKVRAEGELRKLGKK